jgi:hypothetical protein
MRALRMTAAACNSTAAEVQYALLQLSLSVRACQFVFFNFKCIYRFMCVPILLCSSCCSHAVLLLLFLLQDTPPSTVKCCRLAALASNSQSPFGAANAPIPWTIHWLLPREQEVMRGVSACNHVAESTTEARQLHLRLAHTEASVSFSVRGLCAVRGRLVSWVSTCLKICLGVSVCACSSLSLCWRSLSVLVSVLLANWLKVGMCVWVWVRRGSCGLSRYICVYVCVHYSRMAVVTGCGGCCPLLLLWVCVLLIEARCCLRSCAVCLSVRPGLCPASNCVYATHG